MSKVLFEEIRGDVNAPRLTIPVEAHTTKVSALEEQVDRLEAENSVLAKKWKHRPTKNPDGTWSIGPVKNVAKRGNP